MNNNEEQEFIDQIKQSEELFIVDDSFPTNSAVSVGSNPTEESFDSELVEIQTECMWNYRNGYALEETQREYELLRFFLQLGRARRRSYLSRIFNVSTTYINKISEKNNWYERIEAYDRQTYLNALSQESQTRRELHEEKLEVFRAQQETLANQASSNAAKILHLIQRKLDKLVEDTDNLSIDELVSTGNLAVKFSQLQKELGSQALAVDALLEAIDGDEA